MLLNSLEAVVARLRRHKTARKQFVESHINKTLAHQIRATRDRLGWSQERLAREVGMTQNGISRLESPDYGRQTITTLKRLASALDVALVVRLVPFSELAHWVTGTSYVNKGLSTESLAVPDFSTEDASDAFNLMEATRRENKAREELGTLAPEAKTLEKWLRPRKFAQDLAFGAPAEIDAKSISVVVEAPAARAYATGIPPAVSAIGGDPMAEADARAASLPARKGPSQANWIGSMIPAGNQRQESRI